ncbi:MAG: hypothetical protein KF819_16585 [Labilithrix sp.]|nr:hypothetical protein [Labilithrix sp.]
MHRSLAAMLVFAGVACAGDRGEFHPAKGAADMPPVTEAYRVKKVAPACVALGYVSAEGPSGMSDVAQTAARHGANNFIIRSDDTDERVTAQGGGGLVTQTNHKLFAEIFRCPDDRSE